MRDQVQQVLDTLRQENGLYVASPSLTYRYIWIRDVCYIALSELYRDNGRFEQTYHRVLDIFRKYEWKLAYHAKVRPVEAFEYVHPRYDADLLEEMMEPWGNAQNDAIGALLFGIGQGLARGKCMLRDDGDKHVVELLVAYLTTLEYWHDADNGIWEENREVHASSIGACVAGLLAVEPYVDVPMHAIQNGLSALFQWLPNESVTKNVDLALLSLIYPYRLLPRRIADIVVQNVEQGLLRSHGVIRYVGDAYYREDGKEAEWCMGLPWLGLCHAVMGNEERALQYLQRTFRVMTNDGHIPELYIMGDVRPNENTPLGWSHSLCLLLYDTLALHGVDMSRIHADEFAVM